MALKQSGVLTVRFPAGATETGQTKRLEIKTYAARTQRPFQSHAPLRTRSPTHEPLRFASGFRNGRSVRCSIKTLCL